MTLSNVPRYDPDRIRPVGDRAVVVGAGVAGLVTAGVLADAFAHVTVVERDPLPDDPAVRRGVPQGEHVHVLQEAGRATFEDLFPGFGAELLSAGGLVIDALSDFAHYEKGGFLADGRTRLPMFCATRPLFEQVVRRRVADLDGVTLRSGCQFTEYVDDGPAAVRGVRLRDGDAEPVQLDAELVVDATGRTSRTPAWLEANGYPTPEVEEVHIDLAYSTVAIDRPADDRSALFVPPDPPRTRGMGMFPVEDDRWLVTMAGVHGDHPPTEPAELTAFAERLPVDRAQQLLDGREWVSDGITHYRFPTNRRRRYEAFDRFPEGLLVVGDAICSFNPIYGQGMSVAALEALLVHHALASGGRERLALRFFERAEPVVDSPWSIAVGGDFEFPQTRGPKPPGTDLFNRYVARLMSKAQSDGRLREALYRVFMMERPPTSLLRPSVAWRVLAPAV
jgi:2-polyprenyl-6-methoxyphenol hydroxylase-like FAD-dependent oxidoreductase